MPTSAATARAARSWSPVSSTGSRPSSRSRATASAEVALTVSDDDEHAARGAVPADEHRGAALGLRRVERLGELGRHDQPLGLEQCRAAHDRTTSRDVADHAEALAVGEAAHLGVLGARGGLGHGARDRVLGAVLQRGGDAAYLVDGRLRRQGARPRRPGSSARW